MKESERRHKIVLVPWHQVLAFFCQPPETADRIFLNRVAGLPEDATVVNVYNSPASDCFTFVVEHPSFPPSEPGFILERLNVNIEIVPLDKKKAD